MIELSQTVKIFIYEIKLGKIKKIHEQLNYEYVNFNDLKKHYFKVTDKILRWKYLLEIFKNKDLANDFFTNKNKYEINKKITSFIL